tara:strand:+ start:306 stop:1310 length:1005 start_codon:yes stop_codon:yes gene_type:complete
MHLERIEEFSFDHGLHFNSVTGEYSSLNPHTLGRPLTHLEMDFNLLYQKQTLAGFRIAGSEADLTMASSDLAKTLTFVQISNVDPDWSRWSTAGLLAGQFIWHPTELVTTTQATTTQATTQATTAATQATTVATAATTAATQATTAATAATTAATQATTQATLATTQATAATTAATQATTQATQATAATTQATNQPELAYFFHLGNGTYPYAQDLIGGTWYKADNSVAADFAEGFADALANPSSYETITSVSSISSGDQFVFPASQAQNFFWLLIPDSYGIPDLTGVARLADTQNNINDVAAQVLTTTVNGNPYKLYRVNLAQALAGVTIQYNE